METFSALLAICEGNSPVPSEFPIQRPVTRSFDVFFICTWINFWVDRDRDRDRDRDHDHDNDHDHEQFTKNHKF